jgi:hypothetical protein
MGREAALIAKATRAGRAWRSSTLLRMGKKDVSNVAISAKRAGIAYPGTTLGKSYLHSISPTPTKATFLFALVSVDFYPNRPRLSPAW